jgi:hypothetical protein
MSKFTVSLDDDEYDAIMAIAMIAEIAVSTGQVSHAIFEK